MPTHDLMVDAHEDIAVIDAMYEAQRLEAGELAAMIVRKRLKRRAMLRALGSLNVTDTTRRIVVARVRGYYAERNGRLTVA